MIIKGVMSKYAYPQEDEVLQIKVSNVGKCDTHIE